MNSYYDDEPPHAQRGQAKVPGGGAFGPSDDGYDPFDPFADPQGGGQSSAAPQGPPPPAGGQYGGDFGGGHGAGGYAAPTSPADRGLVGRASVRPPSGGGDANPYGAGAGRGGFDEGFDPFGGESPVSPASSGRASVPGSVGRAGVGRASVSGPGGPGGPNRPGGPNGPGGSRPGGPGGELPGGKTKDKKKRRRNRILASFAVMTILLGLAVISVAYYSASIPVPADYQPPQSTTLYYSDGKTVMARIGTENRQLIPLSQVPLDVQHAVVATEDESFYSNVGVDFKGIARAFVNNITGGETQGASTITQQYARNIAKLTYSASYTRKMREIVIAYKLHNKYSKQEILGDYLNTVLFGRNAYGIEAAAEAYFNKHASDLTTAEGMVLAGLIKDPNGGIYDPSSNLASAQKRWQYTRVQMLKLKFITQAVYDKMTYPTDYIKPKNLVGSEMDTATGFIVHHVMSELMLATKTDGKPAFPTNVNDDNSLKNGGYKIITTIDKNAQNAAERYASGSDPKSPMRDLKKGLGASLVAVQPGTGKVIAYYGGENGSGIDRSGIFNDPVTSEAGWSGANQIPGSSFKTITMATALQQHLSVNSYWYGPEVLQVPGRPPVHNVTGEACPGSSHVCTMKEGLRKSLNTMFYQIGTFKDPKANITMTPGKIVDMAYDLGIQNIWPATSCPKTHGARIPLNGKNGAEVTGNGCITPEVSFGQYGVAVQDMANVMATYAASGVRATEHFVDHVTQGTGDNVQMVYKSSWDSRLVQVPVMNESQWNDLTWAMQSVYGNADEADNQLANGRQAAAKTGTWQLPTNENQNGWVFFNGFTAHGDGNAAGSNGQIAVTASITYTGNKPAPVVYKNGKNVSSHGTPAKLWQLFVDAYVNNGPGGKPYPVERFSAPSNTGDPSIGGAPSPTPTTVTPNPTDSGCGRPQNCPTGGPTGPGSGQTTPPPPAGPLSINVTKLSDTPLRAHLNWDNSTAGAVTINWGDGQTSNGNTGQGATSHKYNTPGSFTITVTDADDPSRSASKQFP